MEEESENLTDYSEDGVDLTLVRWFLSLYAGGEAGLCTAPRE